jgi:hypothetical protein
VAAPISAINRLKMLIGKGFLHCLDVWADLGAVL